jgi:hypothetical protein
LKPYIVLASTFTAFCLVCCTSIPTAVARGTFARPLLWPLTPVSVILQIFDELPLLAESLRRSWHVLAITLALYGALFYAIAHDFWLPASLKQPLLWAVLGMVSLSFLSLILTESYRWLMDYLRWRRWLGRRVNVLSALDMLRQFREFRVPTFRTLLIRDVRLNGRLAPTAETVQLAPVRK